MLSFSTRDVEGAYLIQRFLRPVSVICTLRLAMCLLYYHQWFWNTFLVCIPTKFIFSVSIPKLFHNQVNRKISLVRVEET